MRDSRVVGDARVEVTVLQIRELGHILLLFFCFDSTGNRACSIFNIDLFRALDHGCKYEGKVY